MNQLTKTANLQNINSLPADSIAIELLDENMNHLIFIACQHDGSIAGCNFNDDRDTEALFMFEQEMVHEFLKSNSQLQSAFAYTGRIVATGRNSTVLYSQQPA